jgi:hypothetical protein
VMDHLWRRGGGTACHGTATVASPVRNWVVENRRSLDRRDECR